MLICSTFLHKSSIFLFLGTYFYHFTIGKISSDCFYSNPTLIKKGSIQNAGVHEIPFIHPGILYLFIPVPISSDPGSHQFCLSPYFRLICTTRPPSARSAMALGITMSPLKKSASDHTSSSFRVEPMTMQITTSRE